MNVGIFIFDDIGETTASQNTRLTILNGHAIQN